MPYLRKGKGRLASAAHKRATPRNKHLYMAKRNKRRSKGKSLQSIRSIGSLRSMFPPRLRMTFRLGYSCAIPVASFGGAGVGSYTAQVVMTPYLPINATGYSQTTNLPAPYDALVVAATANPLGFKNLFSSSLYNQYRPLSYKAKIDIMPDSTADQINCSIYPQAVSNAQIPTGDFDRATEMIDAQTFVVGVAQQKRSAFFSRRSGYYAGMTPIQTYHDTNNVGTIQNPAIGLRFLDCLFIHLQNAQLANPAQVVMLNVQAWFTVELSQFNTNALLAV